MGGSYTPPAGCESVCPNTALTDTPDALSGNVSPTFAFTASEANATFECKMDAGSFQPCSSPKRYTLLSEGEHNFQVRAKNASGAVDPTPAHYTWEVDSLAPKLKFTERPGNATGPGYYETWVTNDRSPTWAWTVRDPNPNPDSGWCELHQGSPYNRDILDLWPCPSPLAVDAELPDGNYGLEIYVYDRADNSAYLYNEIEVDTVAPKIVSIKPTGTMVGRYADVRVIFNDDVVGSGAFVNIYKRGTNTPLPVSRYAYGDEEIEITPRNGLAPGTWYTVKVTTGVTDGANNLAAPRTWSFKTTGMARG